MSIKKLAISIKIKIAYIRLPWVSKISGPGIMPCIINPPKTIAVVVSPGIPKVNRGIIAPPIVALFAVSDATRPLISPLPNFSGVLDCDFATVYAIKFEVPPPIPGRIPIPKPIIADRNALPSCRINSVIVIPKPLILTFGISSGCCSVLSVQVFNTSEIAYKPTNTVKILKPDFSVIVPNVKRGIPTTGSMPTVDNIKPKTPVIKPLIIFSDDRTTMSTTEKRATAKYS